MKKLFIVLENRSLNIESHQYRNSFSRLRPIIFITTLLGLTGCANLIKAGSIDKVHRSFDNQQYQETLVLVRRAENLSELDSRIQAELTYIKARSFAELGNTDEANALYEYLRSQHTSSPYAWLAELHLNETGGPE